MSQTPITMLLAEDDHDDRYLISEALDESGVENQLYIVENGEDLLDYLKSVKTHPCAEDIYKAVKKKLPNISLGTVYRVLNNFKEKGEILEIPFEVAHYDGDTSSHAHFICEKCKKIFDIFE